jgi:lipopolysaccharide transport system ATP-binding protein
MNSNQNQHPTVFHVTHWKAGSQWLHRILRDIALDKIVAPQLFETQFLDEPLVPGAIYPTVYVTKEQFESVRLPSNSRKFVVIRDLRDTLVSAYFSIRYSHAVIDKSLADWRQRLEAASLEDGLFLLMDEWLPPSAQIQESWVASGEDFIRYEDLLQNDIKILEDALIHRCQIPISADRLREIVLSNRFESATGGRKPGEENRMSHERKGIAGDWQNYFTSNIAKAFNTRYGDLLIAAGYDLTDSGA